MPVSTNKYRNTPGALTVKMKKEFKVHPLTANKKLLVPGNWILHPSPLHGRVYAPPKLIDYVTNARVYIKLPEPRPDGRKPFVNIKAVLLAFDSKEKAQQVYDIENKMSAELDQEVQKLRDKYQGQLRKAVRMALELQAQTQTINSGLQRNLFTV